ncbi:MAG TPA: DUF433 domain-containing protein [Candidatus Angelobacter sp.]|jgi:uncharacterized protein (DUF433 family)|nr:DUF433 domain-containing protein [Candidatus Angelobacter sp.]
MIVLETTQNVPLTLTESGAICVTGSRITLESVVYQYQQGNSAEAILESFPTLKLADIHAVICYYLNHRGQVDEYLYDQEKKARSVRDDIESDPAYKTRVGELRARIKSRSGSQHQAE